jgi:hypothetical protein
MKNTLAENMLRFGVKNLSESSKRKLTEGPAKPIQPYAAVNPKSLKFADQATYDNFMTTKLYGNIIIGWSDQQAAVDGKYGKWCLERGNQFISGPPSQYKLMDGYEGTLQVVAAEIAQACVVQGRTTCSAFRDLKLAEFANLDAIQKLKSAGLYRNFSGGPDSILGNEMSSAGGRYKITQANWDYIFKEMEDTINKVIATYTLPVVAPTAAPAGAAKPGTPAPAKKN